MVSSILTGLSRTVPGTVKVGTHAVQYDFVDPSSTVGLGSSCAKCSHSIKVSTSAFQVDIQGSSPCENTTGLAFPV